MKTFSPIRKILIAVEDSEYSEIAASYGFDFARKIDAEVGLLHVSELPVSTPYTMDPMLGEPPIVMPEMVLAQEEASQNLLDRFSEAFGQGCIIHRFIKTGNPTDEILLTAEAWSADMLILGTHGRTGFDHFIAGSVAEKVVRKSRCPVLIIPNKE